MKINPEELTSMGPHKYRSRSCLRALFVALLLAPGVVETGFSQEGAGPAGESRGQNWAALQAEKAGKTKPYQPDRVEALVRRIETMFLLDPSGFYPYFASVYHGGGVTLGAGYRRYYGDNTFWNIQGLYSFQNYKLLEGGTESKGHLNKRLSFGSRLGWRDATKVAYYGLGMKSSPDDRANFRFQQTNVDGHAVFRPIPWVVMQGNVAYEHWETKQGEGSEPSIETRYTPQTAPGLGASPSYVHTQASAGIDWRRSPGYTRRGGLYEVTLDDYRNTGGGTDSFQKATAEVIQHLPLLRETWVLAARGRVETTLNDNNLIPYFMLPSLGSGSTLRAFSSDRFRDRHSMLMNAEFRWIPSVAVDLAAFYDAGKVTSQRNDLSFKGLKSDVGIGARIHGLMATPLRIDFAVGNEGWRLVISGSPIF